MPRTSANWVVCIAVVLVTLVGGLVAWFGVQFYRSFHAFSVEDRIHATFFPVANALYRYADEQGHPAQTLDALVPEYLVAIPSSPLSDAPSYSIAADNQTWELSIHSRALPQPRFYICRSTQQFTPEEMHRIIIRYHSTWAVFPADK